MTTSAPKPDEKKPNVSSMIDREDAAPLLGESADAPGMGSKQEVVGGQIYLGGRLVGYTAEGARSATEGGIKDPTVQEGTGTVTDPQPGVAAETEQKPAPKKK